MPPKYHIETHTTSIKDDDDDASFTVRRNGKLFYIEISPTQFVNSPMTSAKYLQYIEVLQSGEEVVGDIYDTDVYEWATTPYESLFVELAPDPPGDPNDTKITLQEHLFPYFFVFALDIIDEVSYPRRIPTERSPCRPSFVRFDEDFLDDLEDWTTFHDPVGITLSCKDPVDALFKQPRKVLIHKGTVECFFKPCHSTVQMIRELKTYKMIAAAGLDCQLNICRLHGVVMDDCDFIIGSLTTYIDCAELPLSMRFHPADPDDPLGFRSFMGRG